MDICFIDSSHTIENIITKIDIYSLVTITLTFYLGFVAYENY